MREVREEEIRWLLELITPSIVTEVSRVIARVEEKQAELERRLDELAKELEVVKGSVKEVALATASEFVKHAVESAIEAAGRGSKAQITIATEPVVSRLSELEKRIARVESLLEASAEGIAKALESGREAVRRAAEESLREIKGEVAKVSSIAGDVEVVKKGLENLTKLLVQQQRREVQAQLPPDFVQKVEAIFSAVTAIRDRLSLLGRVPAARGLEEEEEEEE
ncbi:MAG: hypothetical protein QXW41_07510 [Fervidicoccaceae archaeon]